MTKKEAVIEEFKKHCTFNPKQTREEKFQECIRLWHEANESFVNFFGPKKPDSEKSAFLSNSITEISIVWFFIGAGLVSEEGWSH